MQSQQFDKRVMFQRPAAQPGKYGQPPVGWEDVKSAFAAIRPAGSNERMAAHQMQSGQTHVVTVPYSPALAVATGAWRLLFKGRPFGIVGLPRNTDEANKELVFDCSEESGGV